VSSKDSAIYRPRWRNHFSPVNRERKREPILKKEDENFCFGPYKLESD